MRSRLIKMEDESGFVLDFFGSLPEGFVAKALSLTSPRDACRLSLVCSVFRSAAEWDAVWESFLPEDYQKIVAKAAEEDGGFSSLSFSSKKQLYLRLCDRPLIIDGGNKGNLRLRAFHWTNKLARNATCWLPGTYRSFGAILRDIGDGFRYPNQGLQRWLSSLVCAGLKSMEGLILPCYHQTLFTSHSSCSNQHRKLTGSSTSQPRFQSGSVGSKARLKPCFSSLKVNKEGGIRSCPDDEWECSTEVV